MTAMILLTLLCIFVACSYVISMMKFGEAGQSKPPAARNETG